MLSILLRLTVLGATVFALTHTSTLYGYFAPDSVTSLVKDKPSRFVKINRWGDMIASDEGPWHCVYDRTLDVVWLVGRDDESPFDSYWSYSWFDDGAKVGVEEKGSCYFNERGCDTRHIREQAIKRKVCNLTHWRLPSNEELSELVMPPIKPGGPTIQSAFFPNTRKGDYWTQTQSNDIENPALSYLKEGAVAVSFKHGNSRVLPYRTAAHVMLVADLDEKANLEAFANSHKLKRKVDYFNQ